MTFKDLSNVTVNSVNLFYLIINKRNGYTEESNVSRYLTLVPTDESKDTRKKYEELWSKIRDMKNYGAKSEIILEQRLITLKIRMKNI